MVTINWQCVQITDKDSAEGKPLFRMERPPLKSGLDRPLTTRPYSGVEYPFDRTSHGVTASPIPETCDYFQSLLQ